jgi:hypothetical protein
MRHADPRRRLPPRSFPAIRKEVALSGLSLQRRRELPRCRPQAAASSRPEVERAAEMEALEEQHRKRSAALKKEAEAGARRQKKLLAELGMEDVSGEELSRRIRAAGGLYIRRGGA